MSLAAANRALRALLVFLAAAVFSVKAVFAHCPLCTIGAGAAAMGAAWLGVDGSVIGVFVGGFAVSFGWWIARSIRKQYVPRQKELLILFSFVTTVVPLVKLVEGAVPFSLFWFGEYGSLFYRTYVINLFLVGGIFGGIIVSVAPWLSKLITEKREGKMVPFQGVALTLLLLICAGVLLQVVV